MTRREMIKSWFADNQAISEFDAPKKRETLAYIEQLEEQIDLMQIQMRGDCGCCKHGKDDDMTRCNQCLTRREYHPLWEYEGLPELRKEK